MVTLSPVNASAEQLRAMNLAMPELLRQLEARKELAQRAFEEEQTEHVRSWIRSFGVEVNS